MTDRVKLDMTSERLAQFERRIRVLEELTFRQAPQELEHDTSGKDDVTATSGWEKVAALQIELLAERVEELERRVYAIENVAIGQVQQISHGCICPPTAEQTCQGLVCPRRAIKIGT